MTLNETNLEKRFNLVSTSQGSIQSLSSLCLHYRNHHKKIAQIWLRCLQKAKVPHRLTLIYLANDIVQNAKRKNTVLFIEDFKSILKDTIPYLRDEKIKKSVERVFTIWQDRNIFDAKFTNELKNQLNGGGLSSHQAHEPATQPKNNQQNIQKSSPHDILTSLNKIAEIEKSIRRLKSNDDNIVDKLAQGEVSDIDMSNSRMLEDLKTYIITLKSEIEERNKLSILLEESMTTQKRLLKESEDQLASYRSQLDCISKLRSDLG